MLRQTLELELELLAEGLDVPEGPVALNDGSLLIVEIQGQRLTRITAAGHCETVAALPGGPNGAAMGPDRWVYICNNGGSMRYRTVDGLTTVMPVPAVHSGGFIQRVSLDSGQVETVCSEVGGRRLESPNDLVFDRTGGLWFTDYGCTTQLGRNYGSVCYLDPSGTVSRVRENLVSPNGIALSPEEDTLYVSDTALGRIWSFAIVAPGKLASPLQFQPGICLLNLQGGQRVDSMAVEASGRLCVATIGDGGVAVIDSDGSAFDFLPVPDPVVTNLCFGGPSRLNAWITASGTGRVYRTRWPRPGQRLNFE